MKTLFLPAIALATALAATSVAANDNTAVANRCITATGAPGFYELEVGAGGLPQVTPAQGGSAAGARNVNDCLADAFQVQYGTRLATAATTPAPRAGLLAATSGRLNCDRILNRSPGQAGLYAAGSALVAGAVGAGVQANVYQRNLNACLARR